MIDKFFEELRYLFIAAGAPEDYTEEIVEDYENQYRKLSLMGKSEFEILVIFGEPETIVKEFGDPDAVPTEEEWLLSNPLLKDEE